MRMIKPVVIVAALAGLAACENPSEDKSVDRGWDDKPLSELQAGIWIDPNGCDHWIIDDGVEGYLSPRLDPRGRPVCSGTPQDRNTAIGDFKGGSTSIIGDAL
ncbi:hypothetical protein [Marivita hallyeonensis]|uniref:Lipoprotein n=1 Tax=Marivita hallyeonensis TaxID=996342 RepID=A0A1M5X4S9_9RHOB|nr:hypothetical protein [Marivita hallyeonensis]SHH94880.1 hypothetical protein SAMN05443551_3742 [Marivita hallyeonensis]